jgi:hypothetical protein
MKLFTLILTMALATISVSVVCAADWVESAFGETAVFKMENAPYPHESRKDGYVYKEKTFPLDPHYNDNSVAIFIPDGYIPTEETNLLFYFHGWGNNIEDAFEKFLLREQVSASGKNVILVFPEGPKNSSDSGLGKMEDKDGIKNLSLEVMDTLFQEKKVPSKALGKVILSGHSGAYRGIAHSLEIGGLDDHLSEVYLLDASYGNFEYFTNWAVRVPDGRLRSIFTKHLAGENTLMMATLSENQVPFVVRMESKLEDADLAWHRLVFVYTEEKKHNETVQVLEMFLRNAKLKDRKMD